MPSAKLSAEKRADLERLLREMRRRRPPPLVDLKFRAQASFIQDPSRLKLSFCTRRAGKSVGAGRVLVAGALETARASCLYLGLTRESAKRIMWKDVLKAMNEDMELGAKFNENELVCTFPNKSCIYLLGADSTDEERRKLLGQKYKAVVIDEAQDFSIDLRELVYGTLKPSVADYRGTICLTGTPSDRRTGLFYDLTKGQDPGVPGVWEAEGWTCHRWSTKDNPYMSVQWEQEIADLVAANPRISETPAFQRNYLGRWTTDESNLVYRFSDSRNVYEELPTFAGTTRGRWHYVLGIDLGYRDPSAFSVLAYHDLSRDIFVVESSKKGGMDLSDVSQRIKGYMSRYDLDAMVVDNANKQAVEEMRRRHDLPLIPADKRGKSDFVELLNADLVQGRLKLHATEARALSEEWKDLVWDARVTARRAEHPSCANHCADATLYAWRYVHAYCNEVPTTKVTPGSDEWYLAEAKATMEAELEILEQEKSREREARAWGFYE